MTVTDLIEALREMPPDAVVLIHLHEDEDEDQSDSVMNVSYDRGFVWLGV